jgi:hypothetical protein
MAASVRGHAAPAQVLGLSIVSADSNIPSLTSLAVIRLSMATSEGGGLNGAPSVGQSERVFVPDFPI